MSEFQYFPEPKKVNPTTETTRQQGTSAASGTNAPKQSVWTGYQSSGVNSVSSVGQDEHTQKVLNYVQVFLSQELSSDDKLDKIVDLYLSDNSEYSELTFEQKKEYRQNFINSLLGNVNPQYQHVTGKEKDMLNMQVMIMLGVSKSEKISLEDMQNMSKSEIQKLVLVMFGKYYDEITSKIAGYEDKSSIEQIHAVANFYLELTDNEYKALPDDQREAKCKQYCNQIASQLLGIEGMDLEKMSEAFPDFDISDFVKFVAQIEDFDIEELKNDPVKQNELILKYLETRGENLSEQGKQITEYLKAKLNLIKEIGKENPTEQDIYNHLKSKDISQLSDIEKSMLRSYELRERVGDPSMDKPAGIMNSLKAVMVITNPQKFLEFSLSKIDLSTPQGSQAASVILEELAAGMSDMAFADDAAGEEAINNIIKHAVSTLVSKGMTEEQARAFVKEHFEDKMDNTAVAAASIATGQADQSVAAIKRDIESGNPEKAARARKITAEAPDFLDNEQATEFGVGVTNIGLEDEFTTGLNKYKTQEDAGFISTNILNSGKLSDSKKASYAKSLVTTTDDDNRKLYYNQELTKINSPSVTEGLAAASNTVKDPNIRNQYNTNIEEAMKNYSAEDQLAIRQAMNSGEISQTTLAKTTVSERTNAATVTSSSQTASAQQIKQVQVSVSDISRYSDTKVKTGTPEKQLVDNYFNYLTDVLQRFETQREYTLDQLSDIVTHIEESQEITQEEAEVLTEVKKTYGGLSERVIKELKQAYITGGMSKLYEALSKISSTAQRVFLIYFAKYGTPADIRSFVEAHRNNLEIIAIICAYGSNIDNLPSDMLAIYFKRGVINASSLKNIRTFALNHKNDRDILEGLFAFSGDVSILAYNYDLITEYLMKGKITIVQLQAAGIYENYKNSLSEYQQQKLENDLDIELASIEGGSRAFQIEEQRAKEHPIPGSPEFYSALNKQAEGYTPNNFTTGSLTNLDWYKYLRGRA
ncbi:hypothetical protein IJ579_09205 [bacterium]|nr:hypothetical protein [bacterium]